MDLSIISSKLATGTAAKTILQLVAATNHQCLVYQLWCDFEGAVTTDLPILVEIMRQTTAGTGSAAVTPKKLGDDAGTLDSSAIEGPAGTWTAEPTSGDILLRRLIHPQGRHSEIFNIDTRIVVPAATRLAIRTTAAVSINCVAGMLYKE